MSNKRSRRPRRPDPVEHARKLRNNLAMRRVYEAAVRQRGYTELADFLAAVREARERGGQP